MLKMVSSIFSTSTQTPITAGMFFTNDRTIYIGKIPLKGLKDRGEATVKWLVDTVGCAHLYFDDCPKLGSQEITEVKKFERGAGQSWEMTLGDTQWLEI